MPTLRTATFWIAALVLPGGVLLLAPKIIRAARKIQVRRKLPA